MYYDDHTEAKLGKVKDPLVRVIRWVKSRTQKEKGIMGCLGGVLVIFTLLIFVSKGAFCCL